MIKKKSEIGQKSLCLAVPFLVLASVFLVACDLGQSEDQGKVPAPPPASIVPLPSGFDIEERIPGNPYRLVCNRNECGGDWTWMGPGEEPWFGQRFVVVEREDGERFGIPPGRESIARTLGLQLRPVGRGTPLRQFDERGTPYYFNKRFVRFESAEWCPLGPELVTGLALQTRHSSEPACVIPFYGPANSNYLDWTFCEYDWPIGQIYVDQLGRQWWDEKDKLPARSKYAGDCVSK